MAISGNNTHQSLRKALGALKDSTTVGLAKVNSTYKGLDVAIVKATNHLEVVPKEKHIRTIFDAVSSSRPRSDVAYCLQTLGRRLSKTHNWAVALKTLIVMHRALREVDPTFQQELLSFSRSRALILNLSHFKDDSSANAWDCSAWVRSYALYLEERLECFHILKYDVETNCSRTKVLDTANLLEQLPALQQLLYRLLSCKPEGMVVHNHLIQYAFSIVAGESIKLYVAIADGILNMVDKFFEMQRHDAIKALDIYRKSGSQAESLSEFFDICSGLDFGRGQKFLKIEQPPKSFLTSMEEYVEDAPRVLMLQQAPARTIEEASPKATDVSEADLKAADTSEDLVNDKEISTSDEEKPEQIVTSPEPAGDHSENVASHQVTDLLGLDDYIPEASELDEKNSHALAIVKSENPSSSTKEVDLMGQTGGWELALVTAQSTNDSALVESKLGGGLDKLTLDSLYDDAMARTNQNEMYNTGREAASNPFGAMHTAHDPFCASHNIAPPTDVQMAAMAQQQALMLQQQQPMTGHSPSNPFGNPFEAGSHYPHHNSYPGLI